MSLDAHLPNDPALHGQVSRRGCRLRRGPKRHHDPSEFKLGKQSQRRLAAQRASFLDMYRSQATTSSAVQTRSALSHRQFRGSNQIRTKNELTFGVFDSWIALQPA